MSNRSIVGDGTRGHLSSGPQPRSRPGGHHLAAPDSFCHSRRMNRRLDEQELTSFAAAWRKTRPQSRPIGDELRSSNSETWVRFHSLPNSKRHAENDAERAEVLSRHLTLLGELASSSSASTSELRVITVAWSDSAEPVGRRTNLTSASPEATYWQSVPTDPNDPDHLLWTHLRIWRRCSFWWPTTGRETSSSVRPTSTGCFTPTTAERT